MKRLVSVKLLSLTVLASLGFVSACKEPAQPGQASQDSGADQMANDQSNSQWSNENIYTDDDNDYNPCRSSTSSGSSRSVTYTDIRRIIKDSCLSCHDVGGSAEPVLASYDDVSQHARSIVSEIKGGTMPPSRNMKVSSSDLRKISDWISDGKKESSSSDSESDFSEEDSDWSLKSSDDCDDGDLAEDDSDSDSDSVSDGGSISGSATPDPTLAKEAAMKELLNPKNLDECHTDGKVYDRGKDKCHISSIAKSFDCSVDGVVKKFQALGITLKTSAGKLIGFEDYTVDQCGEYNGDPVVFFYKELEDSETGDVGISVKVLCKKNSPACQR